MSVEALHDMKSRHQQNIERGGGSETCMVDGTAADLGPVTGEDICSEDDRYVAAEERPATFIGTFSDTEDESHETDTKFVH